MILYALPLSAFPSYPINELAMSSDAPRRSSRVQAHNTRSTARSRAHTNTSAKPPATPRRSTSQLASINDEYRQSKDVESTPHSHGAASLSVRPQGFGANDAKYYREHYKSYIQDDLETSRVFVHFEDFLSVALNITPEVMANSKFRDLSNLVMTDTKFQQYFEQYEKQCASKKGKVNERKLYDTRVKLYNSALDVLDKRDTIQVPLGDRLRFIKNDPKHLRYGVFAKGVVPDIMSANQILLAREIPKEIRGAAMMGFTEEVKANVGNLFDGIGVPRVMMDGKDPKTMNSPEELSNNNGNHNKEENKDDATSDSEPDDEYDVKLSSSIGAKRKLSRDPSSVPSKVPRNSHPFSASRHAAAVRAGPRTATKKIRDTAIQAASYAMEALSLTPLRSHFLMSVVDRRNFQLHYYDSSSILVTNIINICDEKKRGKEFFVAFLIGFHRLSLKDLGFRTVVDGSDKFFRKAGFLRKQLGLVKAKRSFYNLLTGMSITTGDGATYIIDAIIFRQLGIVGRLTYVLRAHNKDTGARVVIKISCPDASRKSEIDLLNVAKEAAKNDTVEGDTHWVLNHLPNIIFSEDRSIGESEVHERVADFLNNAAYVEDNKFFYHRRVLRIVVLEELHPIENLPKAVDFAQVFFDILLCHKWLYDVAKILHRDISASNIMYRIKDGKLYGVLNDLDLSSLIDALKAAETTSYRRTGTPPFMALDLLNPDLRCQHLYRHDLESLFYVMLVLTSRHYLDDSVPKDKKHLLFRHDAPLSAWFDSKMTWSALYHAKHSYIHDKDGRPYQQTFHESFRGFSDILGFLHRQIRKGLEARQADVDETYSFEEDSQETERAEFDEETLGGHVTYEKFYLAMKKFTTVQLDPRRVSTR